MGGNSQSATIYTTRRIHNGGKPINHQDAHMQKSETKDREQHLNLKIIRCAKLEKKSYQITARQEKKTNRHTRTAGQGDNHKKENYHHAVCVRRRI